MHKCFVIMPFNKEFNDYYNKVIKPALATLNINCTRGDEIYSAGVILNNIYDAIYESDFCIVDVTGKNPNVNYELGMAHALGKPTILLTQRIEDVPFDYRHLRLITYIPSEQNWEKDTTQKIIKTVEIVVARPNEQIAINSVTHKNKKNENSMLKKHIENIFYSQSYDLNRINKIFFEKDYCFIKTQWKGISKSLVYHLCHNIICDLPGNIKVQKAYDRLNARDMDCYITLTGPQHLTYFFIFNQFKSPNQPFEAETEVYAPGYLDVKKLLETGEALMSTQALGKGFRYTNKEDWLHFPKTKAFSTIIGEYISHPNIGLIGKRINLEKTKDYYILKLKYSSQTPYQQETGARILLNRK